MLPTNTTPTFSGALPEVFEGIHTQGLCGQRAFVPQDNPQGIQRIFYPLALTKPWVFLAKEKNSSQKKGPQKGFFSFQKAIDVTVGGGCSYEGTWKGGSAKGVKNNIVFAKKHKAQRVIFFSAQKAVSRGAFSWEGSGARYWTRGLFFSKELEGFVQQVLLFISSALPKVVVTFFTTSPQKNPSLPMVSAQERYLHWLFFLAHPAGFSFKGLLVNKKDRVWLDALQGPTNHRPKVIWPSLWRLLFCEDKRPLYPAKEGGVLLRTQKEALVITGNLFHD